MILWVVGVCVLVLDDLDIMVIFWMFFVEVGTGFVYRFEVLFST